MGLVRLKQGNIIEAFFHSFRAVEGLMSELIVNNYKPHIGYFPDATPYLKSTVCQDNQYPLLVGQRELFINNRLELYSSKQFDRLIQMVLPTINNDNWIGFFNHTKYCRNRIYHRLIPLVENNLFDAWKVSNQQEWENKILDFLNFLSKQNYPSLEDASLMAEYHKKIKDLILTYHP